MTSDLNTIHKRLLQVRDSLAAITLDLATHLDPTGAPPPAPDLPPPPPVPPLITPPTGGLTRVFYDEAASLQARRIVTTDANGSVAHYAHIAGGCEIMLPQGQVRLPAWGAIVLDRNARYQGPRTIRIVGQADTVLSSTDGGLALSNRTPIPVAFDLSDFTLHSLSWSGDALDIRWPCNVTLVRVHVTGGKNCLFSGAGAINISATDCTFSDGGRPSGEEHIAYLGYINDVRLVRCQFRAPVASEGHALKCYSKWLYLRDCTISQGEPDEPEFHSLSIPFDRGAWGETYAAGNIFVRNHPQSRPHFMNLQNRRYPAPLNYVEDTTWGTVEVDYHGVDNRDVDNPLLFKHVFTGNTFVNTADDRGVLIWNNGTAPWDRTVRGRKDVRPVPSDWELKHERCVAYMHNSIVTGRPIHAVGETIPYLQRNSPGVRPRVVELDELPATLLAMAER